MNSEFGKGTTYCLGLFLAHAERKLSTFQETDASLWFYCAGDHIIELQIPHMLEKCTRIKLEKFKEDVLKHRFSTLSTKVPLSEQNRLIQEAKDLLRELDFYLDVTTEKGEWE